MSGSEGLPYAARRKRLAEVLGDGVLVVPTAREAVRNGDSLFPFRPDSRFHYLTGFPEPEAVLVLVTGKGEGHRSILFCREKNPEREMWDGFRFGPDGAKDAFGFDEARPIGDLDSEMKALLSGRTTVHFALGADPLWDARLAGWLRAAGEGSRDGRVAPRRVEDFRFAADGMRLVKDAGEISLMRRSAEITALAHKKAMSTVRPGMMEYELEAVILGEFRRGGASAMPAYSTIVASGAGACVLHYVENSAKIRDGDLVLVDAGCEFGCYAGDVTRTFPANGKYSGASGDLYRLVLEAQLAAIGAVRPGASWNDPHEKALEVLVQGFVDMGLCRGSVDGVLESGDYKRFFMHKTGHWLGLDVHDVGEYKDSTGRWTALSEGMVLTVEPGCYVRPGPDVPERFWNIGIRIEDDVLVTSSGCEVMTSGAPKRVGDVEEWMAIGRDG